MLIHLVSDDDKNGGWNANMGITAPNRTAATHNGGLSPSFFERSGRVSVGNQGYTDARGILGFYWSNSIRAQLGAYFIELNVENTYPSHHWNDNRILVNPLRCLVSTTNS